MRATVCAFTLSIALLAVVPSAARTAAAPRPTIVFSTTRTPNWWAGDLFVVEASGRRRNTTTTPGVPESDPDWSPTGAELAFSRERSRNADVYVRDATGTVRRLTTAPEADTSPVWSPDGERMAFARSADNRQMLWVMNRDGSGQRPISPASTEILSPSWSPDGSRIAYLDGRRVAVAEVAGGETRIVSEKRVTLALVWWSDDRIVVVLDGPNGARRLQSLGPDGEAVRDEPNPCGNEFPKWSSDRRHVLCMPWWLPPTARVIRADGAEVRRLRLAPRN